MISKVVPKIWALTNSAMVDQFGGGKGRNAKGIQDGARMQFLVDSEKVDGSALRVWLLKMATALLKVTLCRLITGLQLVCD